jgi:signal transduction histidine kinase
VFRSIEMMFRIFSILVVILLLSGVVVGNGGTYLSSNSKSDIGKLFKEPVNWHSSNCGKYLATLNKLYFKSEHLNYELGIIYARTLVGYHYSVSGNDHLSMLYWKWALKYALSEDDLRLHVINLSLIRVLRLTLEDRCEQAVYALQRAIRRGCQYRPGYKENSFYLYDQFRINNLYAHLYFKKKDAVTADVYLPRSKLYRANQYERAKFVNEYNQAHNSVALGDFQACRKAVDNFIEITNALYSKEVPIVPCYMLLVKISFELEEYSKIHGYANFFNGRYKYSGYPKERMTMGKLLIASDGATGNFRSAFSRRQHLQNLTDSLHNRINIPLNKFYENEHQVINSKEALKIEQIHSSQKGNYIIIISAAGVLILIFVYLWLRATNLNQRRMHRIEKIEFSNDIHDGINPILSYIRTKLASHDQGQDVDFAGLVKMLDSAILQTRKLCFGIRSSNEYYELQSALRSSVETYKQTYHIDVDFHYKVGISIPPQLRQQIAFITDELLLNTWKHTTANRNLLHLYSSGKVLTIVYGDNGGGFDWSTDHQGVGLVSIQHRVHRHNGTVSYIPTVALEELSYQLIFTFLIK